MELESTEIELDLLPEHHHYRDDGCDFANTYLGHQSSCLNCPLPKCIYDQPGGRQRWLKRQRDREIVRLVSTEGMRVKELAMMFGVSQRTVQRVLENSLPTLSPSRGEGEGRSPS